MPLNEILKLGNPLLLKVSEEVKKEELPSLLPQIERMWELILEFRKEYGRGRAIAAPQIGLLKRIICLNITEPQVLINPEITYRSNELIEIWDDCMCFPNLLVKLHRNKMITISFYNMEWEKEVWELEDDMSELIQHEYDHLDGVLAITKAKNIECFRWVD